MSTFHHKKLPDHSALLMGRAPRDETGFPSQRLQIWYNNTDKPWQDDGLHAHRESDECFVVLQGSLTVEVAGETHEIRVGDCCFPAGVHHAVVGVETPARTLMIRAPSVEDKVYRTNLH